MIKRVIYMGLIGFASVGLAMQASAQTVFMVQLGSFESERAAQQHWTELSAKYPDLFDNLRYTPNEIVSKPDNFISYRTQAGPIPTRAEAEELCTILAENDTECYVIETAMFFSDDEEVTAPLMPTIEEIAEQPIPPVPVQTAQEITPPLPEQVPAAQVPQDLQQQPVTLAPPPMPLNEQAEQMGVQNNTATADTAYALPSSGAVQVDTPPAIATQSIPGAGEGRGSIAVAEAIPVPLSQPQSNPYLERGNRMMDAHPSNSSAQQSFWADISYFRNETDAMRYVQLLKSRDNLLPSKLRIRITKPFGNIRGAQKLSLRMGPFLTVRPIRRLCALTREESLRCRAIKDLGGSVRNQGRLANRAESMRGKTLGYDQYRNQTSPSAISGEERKSFNNNNQSQYGSFYVQLGSFLSPQAADDKWQELSQMHKSIMSRLTKDIASPTRGSSASRLYRLRTGPFKDYADAQSLCDTLKTQGTLCLVVKR